MPPSQFDGEYVRKHETRTCLREYIMDVVTTLEGDLDNKI
jgi:hypothetical protein